MRDRSNDDVPKRARYHVAMKTTRFFFGHSALFEHRASKKCVLPRKSRTVGMPTL